MMVRLLTIATLIVALAATAHAQNWVLPPQAPFNTVPNALSPSDKLPLLLQGIGKQAWQPSEQAPSYLPDKQRMPEPPPQQGTRDDVPKFELPSIHFDSGALFNAADIAGDGIGSAKWYGRNLEAKHNYDPHILIQGQETDRDPHILLSESSMRDLMLWFDTKKSDTIQSSIWDQFPQLKIDSSSYLHYDNGEPKLLFMQDSNELLFGSGSIDLNDLSNTPVIGGSVTVSDGSYYYEKNGKRYYMRKAPAKGNHDPGMKGRESTPKAKRVGSSDIWLIDEGTAKTK